jgi:hypothetical protein
VVGRKWLRIKNDKGGYLGEKRREATKTGIARRT